MFIPKSAMKKASGHTSNILKYVWPGIRESKLAVYFYYVMIEPGTGTEIFTIITFFPTRNLVFRKKSTQIPTSILEIKTQTIFLHGNRTIKSFDTFTEKFCGNFLSKIQNVFAIKFLFELLRHLTLPAYFYFFAYGLPYWLIHNNLFKNERVFRRSIFNFILFI